MMWISRARSERGAVFVFVAGAMVVLMLAAGLAVDLGRQRLARRDAQANADVIALDMARVANGRPMTAISAIPGAESGPEQLENSLTRNKIEYKKVKKGVDVGVLVVSDTEDRPIVEVQWGWLSDTAVLSGDPAVNCSIGQQTQIRPDGPFWMPCRQGNSVPNAAKVTVYDYLDHLFLPAGGGSTAGSVARTAFARYGGKPSAEFGLGSTLASVNLGQGALLRGILGNVIPEAAVLGYEGLANATVTLGDLAAGLDLVSPSELVGLEVPFGEFMVATVDALEAGGNSAAAEALDGLATLTLPTTEVNVGEIVGIDNSGSNGLDGVVSVPNLLAISGLAIATNTNAIAIPTATLGVPGLVDVTLDLSVIESAVRIGTADQASGETEQVDLGITVGIDLSGNKQQDVCGIPDRESTLLGSLLGGVLGLVRCLLGAVWQPLGVQIAGEIDLDITAAKVYGTQFLDCGARTLTVAYDSDPATITPTISLDADVTLAGKPLNLLGVTIDGTSVSADGFTGSVPFQVVDDGPTHTQFAPPTYRIGSPNLGLANLLQIGGLEVEVLNTSLPVLGGIARGLVAPLLNTLLHQVDNLLITEVSKLLGLNLGGADITPHWMECDNYGVALVG